MREGGRAGKGMREEGGEEGDSMNILYSTALVYLRCSYFNVGKKRMDQPVEN